MIFLNIPNGTRVTERTSQWTFDGDILGIMSDSRGRLEAASNSILGATGTTYPGSFNARGFENGSNSGDQYSFSGNTLDLRMRVTQPGDWIRVVTAATSVPEPFSVLSLLGIAGVFGYGIKRRKNSLS
ncbi:hypothetical protein [Anabaena sp. CCY 0017]|uniref:hypothetical protein n=1 Tax=Anabaena sp. CCY 0017 TaxID=3103866 RepID=UPI0039C6E3A6